MTNDIYSNIQTISNEETLWLHSINQPFVGHYASIDGYEVFLLNSAHYHENFNPKNNNIFYVKNSIANTDNLLCRLTGTLTFKHISQTIHCLNGYLHNSSGDPAIISMPFGSAYYLLGYEYTPIEYFKILEHFNKNKPEKYLGYDSSKYIEYMTNKLGINV